MEILSTRFGKSMIFTVFAMAKEEISSSKTCMITISPLKSTIDDQISEMLSLSCTAMDLMTETVNFSASRKFTSIFSITRCQRITHSSAIQRTLSAIVVDESHIAVCGTPYFSILFCLVQLKFKLQLKSEDRAIRKNTTSCKQHLKSRAQRQNIHGQRNYKPRLLGLQLSRSRHFSRKRPKKLKYLFSRNKKLQALRVVKEISTLQLHLRSTNSNQQH